MKLSNCNKCALRENASQVVKGSGNKNADLFIIGEAPGETEDEVGKPFVGASGKLLNEVLEQFGIKRSDVFITNVCKCRPPDNRRPTDEEVEACSPWLQKELKKVNPKLILVLGETAMQRVLGYKGISSRRGKRHKSDYGDVFVAYHPSYALRGKKNKKVFVSDISRLSRILKGETRKKETVSSKVTGKKSRLVHLHVHDEYSVLDGCGKPEQFVIAAQKLGMRSLAQTNHRSISGAPSFIKACEKGGIKPIVGAEIEVVQDMYYKDKSTRGQAEHLTVWCDGNRGYKNLLKLITISNLEGFYHKPRVDWDAVHTHREGLLFGTACLGGPLSRAKNRKDDIGSTVKKLKSVLGDRFFLEVMGNDMPEQADLNKMLEDVSLRFGLPLLATMDAHYPTPYYSHVHDVLLMIQTNSNIATPNRFRFPVKDLYLCSTSEMERRLLSHGLMKESVRKAINNTSALANMVDAVKIDRLDVKDALPKLMDEPHEFISNESKKLLARYLDRYGYKSKAKKYRIRLKHELKVIREHGLSNYFVIAKDIIDFCRNKGIRTGSRGSAAGSLVAFMFGITKVDPLIYGLMFERFLGPERLESGSLPDVDLDIDYLRRPEVINYIEDKYGSDCVSPSCTFPRMNGKSVIRDVARTQLVPVREVEKAVGELDSSKLDESSEDVFSVIEDTIEQSKVFRKFKEKYEFVIDSALKLEGQVRHLSVHPAGYIISKKKLSTMTPMIKVGKKFATGYEAKELEDIGLTKFDLLGLRTLSVLEHTKASAKKNGSNIDFENIPLDNEKVYEEFSKGNTSGIFQFDGGAIRLLKRWNPRSILDLTMVNASNRPGPLSSGMAERIMKIRTGEDVESQNPVLDELLKETHGALVYQEQAMSILREVGGLSLLDVDKVRKLIAKSKGVAAIEEYRSQFLEGALKNGFTEHDAHEIFSFLCEFGGYGFNKAHANAYAYLAYQTMWAKVNYPAEFIASYLSVYGGKESFAAMAVEAMRYGVTIEPPCVSKSDMYLTATSDAVRVGLTSVPYVGKPAATDIISKRPFDSYKDFLDRIDMGKVNTRCVEQLALVGAFDFKATNSFIYNFHSSIVDARKSGSTNSISAKNMKEFSEEELLLNRSKNLGMPFSLLKLGEMRKEVLKEGRRRKKKSTSWRLVHSMDCNIKSGDLVVAAIKNVREHVTKRDELMAFLTVADEVCERSVLVWPDCYEKGKDVFRAGNIIAFRPGISKKGGDMTLDSNNKLRCMLNLSELEGAADAFQV